MTRCERAPDQEKKFEGSDICVSISCDGGVDVATDSASNCEVVSRVP
jgi:hypothetical protein